MNHSMSKGIVQAARADGFAEAATANSRPSLYAQAATASPARSHDLRPCCRFKRGLVSADARSNAAPGALPLSLKSSRTAPELTPLRDLLVQARMSTPVSRQLSREVSTPGSRPTSREIAAQIDGFSDDFRPTSATTADASSVTGRRPTCRDVEPQPTHPPGSQPAARAPKLCQP